jgi:zinc transporter
MLEEAKRDAAEMSAAACWVGTDADACSLRLSYGSDQSGLVCGYLFGRSRRRLPLDTDAACAWLRQRDSIRRNSSGCTTTWPTPPAKSGCTSTRAEEFYESLHEGPRSTRIELADNTLIAVVNDVLHDFTFEPSDISTCG